LTVVTEDMQKSNQLPEIFYEMDFIGIITVGVLPLEYIRYVCQQAANVISVDQAYDDLDIDCILSANTQGSFAMTKYLIGQGHTAIGFVGSIEATSSLYERWCGYQKAMLETGLPVDMEYSILAPSPLISLMSNTTEITRFLADQKKFPTAWLCGNDRTAISLIEALAMIGMRVPDDISIAGFDNIEASGIVTPALTTVNVARTKMGVTAVDKLISNYIKHPEICSRIQLYTDLVIRASVKCVKNPIL